jgi:hypothetical protein
MRDSKATGNDTGHSLTITRHYGLYPQKLKDRAKDQDESCRGKRKRGNKASAGAGGKYRMAKVYDKYHIIV